MEGLEDGDLHKINTVLRDKYKFSPEQIVALEVALMREALSCLMGLPTHSLWIYAIVEEIRRKGVVTGG